MRKVLGSKLKQPSNNTGIWYYLVDSSSTGFYDRRWSRNKPGPLDTTVKILAVRVFPSSDRKHPFVGLHARTPYNPLKKSNMGYYTSYGLYLNSKETRLVYCYDQI
jgi:hypothetical protein